MARRRRGARRGKRSRDREKSENRENTHGRKRKRSPRSTETTSDEASASPPARSSGRGHGGQNLGKRRKKSDREGNRDDVDSSENEKSEAQRKEVQRIKKRELIAVPIWRDARKEAKQKINSLRTISPENIAIYEELCTNLLKIPNPNEKSLMSRQSWFERVDHPERWADMVCGMRRFRSAAAFRRDYIRRRTAMSSSSMRPVMTQPGFPEGHLHEACKIPIYKLWWRLDNSECDVILEALRKNWNKASDSDRRTNWNKAEAKLALKKSGKTQRSSDMNMFYQRHANEYQRQLLDRHHNDAQFTCFGRNYTWEVFGTTGWSDGMDREGRDRRARRPLWARRPCLVGLASQQRGVIDLTDEPSRPATHWHHQTMVLRLKSSVIRRGFLDSLEKPLSSDPDSENGQQLSSGTKLALPAADGEKPDLSRETTPGTTETSLLPSDLGYEMVSPKSRNKIDVWLAGRDTQPMIVEDPAAAALSRRRVVSACSYQLQGLLGPGPPPITLSRIEPTSIMGICGDKTRGGERMAEATFRDTRPPVRAPQRNMPMHPSGNMQPSGNISPGFVATHGRARPGSNFVFPTIVPRGRLYRGPPGRAMQPGRFGQAPWQQWQQPPFGASRGMMNGRGGGHRFAPYPLRGGWGDQPRGRWT